MEFRREFCHFTPANRNNLIGWNLPGASDGAQYGMSGGPTNFPKKRKLVDRTTANRGAAIDQNAQAFPGPIDALESARLSCFGGGALLVIPTRGPPRWLLYAEPDFTFRPRGRKSNCRSLRPRGARPAKTGLRMDQPSSSAMGCNSLAARHRR